MTSIQFDAIELLTHHRLTPDMLLLQLETQSVIALQDKYKSIWTFVKRKHSRRFLMAKTEYMDKFEEIYCTSH